MGTRAWVGAGQSAARSGEKASQRRPRLSAGQELERLWRELWLEAPDPYTSPAASRSHDHFGQENWDHQLKLAVAWNRVDIARSEIFTDEWQWKVGLWGSPRAHGGCVDRVGRPGNMAVCVYGLGGPGGVAVCVLGGPEGCGWVWGSLAVDLRGTPGSQPSDLHPMVLAALISNKPEFVRLFLEQGVQLQDFVTQDTLLHLYNNLEPLCLFHCKLREVLAEDAAAETLQMHHVAQVLRELLGDFTQPLHPRPHCSDQTRLPKSKFCVCTTQAPGSARGLTVRWTAPRWRGSPPALQPQPAHGRPPSCWGEHLGSLLPLRGHRPLGSCSNS